jgi:hypothetical protein
MKKKKKCFVHSVKLKKSKVILYPGQTTPKMKFTDGYWDENGDFIEFNADV